MLRDDGSQLTFRYDAAWLEETRACALSRQLPLQSDAFSGQSVSVFFGGLLPEAGSRDQIARNLGISANNDFAMLERIGGECAGAIALVPEAMEGRATSDDGVRWLSEGEVIGIMDRLPHQPLLAGEQGLRLSLAGAQVKLPVVIESTAGGATLMALPMPMERTTRFSTPRHPQNGTAL